MNYRLISTIQASFRRLFDNSDDAENEALEGMKDVAFFGLMVGSAVASPVFFFDSPTMWHLDMFMFVVSSGGFSLRHRENIKRYGPVMVPLAALLGLVAYSSARTPLKDLVPWLPIGLSLLLLLTTYSLPLFWPNFEGYVSIERQTSLEDGPSQPPWGSIEATLGSIQACESCGSDHRSILMTGRRQHGFLEHQISHMSRSTSPLSRFSSVRDSDIDPNEPASYPLCQRISRSTAEILLNPPQTLPQPESQSVAIPIRPSGPCLAHRANYERSSDEDNIRSFSPVTKAVPCSSASARSESALLEQDVPGNFIC